MGREVKRVALDFRWPREKTWHGYLNPHYKHSVQCFCKGSGLAPDAKALHDQWYGNAPFDAEAYGSKLFLVTDPRLLDINRRKMEWSNELSRRQGHREYYELSDEAVIAETERMLEFWNGSWSHHLIQADVDALVKEDRLCDFTSTFTRGEGWKKKEPAVIPTAEEVNFWGLSGMGHGGVNSFICIRHRAEREGLEYKCNVCKGKGSVWLSKKAQKDAKAWRKTEPPKGEGYQIWETVSEGSPVSPVFADPEELARWMVCNDNSVTSNTTVEQWVEFIRGPGWAPSGVLTSKGYQSGVEAMADMKKEQENANA
jgi:hypothetical protein